jgi:hypothetical protein
MIEERIDIMFQSLPFHVKKEAMDYIEFLSKKYRGKNRPRKIEEARKKFKFDWEGGLAGAGDKMTSVELQHKSMDWRS